MSDVKGLLGSIAKLNGSNWFEWSKEAETLVMLSGLDGILDAADDDVPTTATKLAEWNTNDRKIYAYLYFIIEPNYRSPIVELKSGRLAWAKLKSVYEKDTATNRMVLRQHFYSLVHDPKEPITVYIDSVLSTARRLGAINHKPSDLEISDKLLIALDTSWAPVRTALIFRENPDQPEIELITSALRQFEANENPQSVQQTMVKKEDNTGGEAMLAVTRRGGGDKRRGGELDWGNTQGTDGACFRCGRIGHQAKNCVADMPEEVKRQVLNHASTAFMEEDFPATGTCFAYAAHMSPSMVEDVKWDEGKARRGTRGGRRSKGVQSPAFAW